MPTRDNREIIPGGGFFYDVSLKARLILRLIADRRINPLLKLLPFGSLLYLLFPLDIPGPIDDIPVALIALYLFVELCPPEIVEQHKKQLESIIPGTYRDVNDENQVIEAEFHDVHSEKDQ
ncbi:MAG: hypothetical protein HPY45_00430 [Anaerolineae bacterium]|nr:hypothetical protein [Anaerolineae bacterium]